MKRKKGGFTLVEVLLAIAIFAAVALPLLSIYVQSFKVDKAARGVLNANYISQAYIEKLDAATYQSALSELPSKKAQGDYYLSATIQPHGTGGQFTECVFAQLVMLDGGKMLAVMPDGKWQVYNAVPSSISISVSGGRYTLRCDSTTQTGTAELANCTLMINAMKLPESASPGITLGTGCKADVYCTKANADKIRLTGDGQKHPDMFTGNTSLIHVTTRVYDSATASEPVAVSEAYINIRNWTS